MFIKAAQLRERGEAWHALAVKAGDEGELGHAPKIGTLALQYERLAEELQQKAHEIEHEAELIRHDRQMAGLERLH